MREMRKIYPPSCHLLHLWILILVVMPLPISAQSNCASLDLEILGGKGSIPTMFPEPNCEDGKYLVGSRVSLVANPADGFSVHRWVGTDGDDLIRKSNFVTIRADTTIGVHYVSHEDPALPVYRDTPGGVALGPVELPTKSVIGVDERVRISPRRSIPGIAMFS